MALEMSALEQKIRDERASVYDGMVAIMEKFDASPETVTVEDRADYDKREERLSVLDKDLDRVVKMRNIDAGKDEVAETRGLTRDENDNEMDVYTRAYREWFVRGDKDVSPETKAIIRRGAHTPTDMEQRAQLDANSLQTVQGQGGFMIPQGFWMNLQIAMKEYGGVLPYTNIVKTASGNEMPWPTTNPTGVLGSYITEANQVGFTDFTFGQGILYAWTITSGVILASFQLLNDSAFNVDSFVTDRMGEAIGRKVAAELWSGAGSASKAITGITTAVSANGGAGSGQLLTTLAGTALAAGGPGYVTGNAAWGSGGGDKVFTLGSPSTAVSALTSGVASWHALTGMIAGVDPAYRVAGKCSFFMNDSTVQLERTLTDGFGHPLWVPNTQAGQPDTILGYPVVVDNNSPSISTTASTAGGVLFGDLKTAFVVRQVDMAGTMRLTERYADYLQVGFLGYVRMDAQPNDLRAISVFATGTT
jgi:HK97 family phage major capsid protein